MPPCSVLEQPKPKHGHEHQCLHQRRDQGEETENVPVWRGKEECQRGVGGEVWRGCAPDGCVVPAIQHEESGQNATNKLAQNLQQVDLWCKGWLNAGMAVGWRGRRRTPLKNRVKPPNMPRKWRAKQTMLREKAAT